MDYHNIRYDLHSGQFRYFADVVRPGEITVHVWIIIVNGIAPHATKARQRAPFLDLLIYTLAYNINITIFLYK